MTSFVPHPARDWLLHEAHARPFAPCEARTRFLHYAFATNGSACALARERLSELCRAEGLCGPEPEARHATFVIAGTKLRWEVHAEFTTYTLIEADGVAPVWPSGLRQPGALLAAIRLDVMDAREEEEAHAFDPVSLARGDVLMGAASIASDFRADSEGFVCIRVSDRGLSPMERGSLCQRLLELETYRMLALLGLVEVQRLTPEIDAIERNLADAAGEMTRVRGLGEEELLLERLTNLAARLEAAAVASLYRLSASRAYAAIVDGRLKAIAEVNRAGNLGGLRI